jgi:hypothetical protein
VATQTQSAPRTDFREMPIFLAFVSWWLKEVPGRIIYIGQKSIRRAFEFFSIYLLLRSLFEPWKRDETDTSNMALDDKLRVLMMNLVSRLVGAVVRGGTIFVGLFVISGVFIATLAATLAFLLFPVIIVYFIINAFSI